MAHDHIHDEHHHEEPAWLHRRKSPPMFLVALLLLALTFWIGAKGRNAWREYKFIGVPIERNTITVTGEGKVVAVPDIATVDLGASVERTTVAAAQQENTRIMNALVEGVKGFGVRSEDIQTTSYQIYPQYDYSDGQTRLRGYQVSQNVRVKVRALDRLSDILGLAGSLGANQVGGITFTVDEPEAIKAQAREEALEQAKAKAKALAKIADVTLRRVVSFSENASVPPIYQPYFDKAAELGRGGASAPTVEAGSTEFVLNVSVTYEIE